MFLLVGIVAWMRWLLLVWSILFGCGSSGFGDFVRLFGLWFGVGFVLVFCVVGLVLVAFNSVVVFSFMFFPFVVLIVSLKLVCLLICLRFARLAYWSLWLRACGVVVYAASCWFLFGCG